jgi:hypothetical protein
VSATEITEATEKMQPGDDPALPKKIALGIYLKVVGQIRGDSDKKWCFVFPSLCPRCSLWLISITRQRRAG